jgi:hypothetical protein
LQKELTAHNHFQLCTPEIEEVEDNSVRGLFLLEVVAEVGVDGG